MVIDLHTHTQYSYDAEPYPVREHIASAAQKGIDILGFTEHVEFFRNKAIMEPSFYPAGTVDYAGMEREIFPFRDGQRILPDLTAQQRDIAAGEAEFADKLTLRYGVELGEPYAAPALADELLTQYHFDYVIGSVHHLKNDADMYFINYEQVSAHDVLLEYLDEMQALLDYGNFQILAHIDYPLRVMKLPHTRPSFKGYMDIVDVILHRLIEQGIAMECNTKGMYGWQQQIGPEDFILSRYRELGGELITVGSDSHAPETVGRGIPEALERLKQFGFRYVTDFKDKNILQHPLD